MQSSTKLSCCESTPLPCLPAGSTMHSRDSGWIENVHGPSPRRRPRQTSPQVDSSASALIGLSLALLAGAAVAAFLWLGGAASSDGPEQGSPASSAAGSTADEGHTHVPRATSSAAPAASAADPGVGPALVTRRAPHYMAIAPVDADDAVVVRRHLSGSAGTAEPVLRGRGGEGAGAAKRSRSSRTTSRASRRIRERDRHAGALSGSSRSPRRRHLPGGALGVSAVRGSPGRAGRSVRRC